MQSTNNLILVVLFAVFATSSGCVSPANNVSFTSSENILMLPAPEDVFQMTSEDVLTNFMIVYEHQPFMGSSEDVLEYVADVEDVEDVQDVKRVEDVTDVEDVEIHEKSLRLAGFVAQLFMFLFVYTIITIDFDLERYDVYPLHRAQEIQTMPLPARTRVQIVRLVESTC